MRESVGLRKVVKLCQGGYTLSKFEVELEMMQKCLPSSWAPIDVERKAIWVYIFGLGWITDVFDISLYIYMLLEGKRP